MTRCKGMQRHAAWIFSLNHFGRALADNVEKLNSTLVGLGAEVVGLEANASAQQNQIDGVIAVGDEHAASIADLVTADGLLWQNASDQERQVDEVVVTVQTLGVDIDGLQSVTSGLADDMALFRTNASGQQLRIEGVNEKLVTVKADVEDLNVTCGGLLDDVNQLEVADVQQIGGGRRATNWRWQTWRCGRTQHNNSYRLTGCRLICGAECQCLGATGDDCCDATEPDSSVD